MLIKERELKKFFNLSYGDNPPSRVEWENLYNKNVKFARTQDLKKIQTFVYSLMIWKNKTFLKKYKKDKNAILCGKTFFYPVKSPSTIMVKKFEDLKLANYLMKSSQKKFLLKYDKIANSFLKNKKKYRFI